MKLDPSARSRHPKLAWVVLALTVGLFGCAGDSTGPSGAEPAISSVSGDVIRAGETITITGHNFRPSPSENEVRLHGVDLTVVEANATSLTVRLPDFLCIPSGPAPLRVRVSGQTSDAYVHTFEGSPGLELERGEFARMTAGEGHCLLLDESGSTAEYLIGTQRVSNSAGSQSVVHQGRVPGQGLPTSLAGTSRVSDSRSSTALSHSGTSGLLKDSFAFPAPPAPAAEAEEAAARWQRHRAAESRLRAKERELQGRVMGSLDPARADASRPAPIGADVQPGDAVSLMVPDISGDNFCQEGVSVEGVVRRVGERSVWVADVENPEGGFTAEHYDILSDAFDDVIHDEVAAHFGEPTDVDSNGRIVILISQAVNRVTESLGFVVSTDFTSSNCPGSNYGEYYYARAPDPEGDVPDPDGETGKVYTASRALSDQPRLLAHELTHILQFGKAVTVLGSTWQPVWILEGQATMAEEVLGHRYGGYGPRQNLGGAVAFHQDYPPTGVGWYLNPFLDLGVYFGFGGVQGGQGIRVQEAPHECNWFSVKDPDPCISGRIAYGVSWSLLRWISDHYGEGFAGGEQEIQQRLMTTSEQGIDALAQVVGEEAGELLGRWAASLWADGRVPGLDPLLTFPSWNLRPPQGIEAGLRPEAHLAPAQRSFGDFENNIQVAGSSSHYQLIGGTGGHSAFALSATAQGGNPLPGNMQLWVVRTR
ncbi:MAG: IPT/TIG domain-containing protein [Gemmatimonadota bacterium]